jgi:hypothetical protein
MHHGTIEGNALNHPENQTNEIKREWTLRAIKTEVEIEVLKWI